MTGPLPSKISDFDDPLGVLRAEQDRILEHCDILEKLAPHIAENGIDDEARSAISRVLNYFTTGAVHHHRDKEENLFPIVNRQSLKLADIIYRLKREYAEIASSWDTIRIDLKKPAAINDNKAFTTQVEKFCHGYRQYIAYEASELLSIAQHILSQRQLEELGDAMARRRGVKR
ncbi:MAG: hemerythrin domain-containing protein [Thiogranum sp.]|jgi:hemerythrin-like domain-containing protein